MSDITEALDRFRAGSETGVDVILLSEAYDFLTESALVTEELLRAEGFEVLDDDTGVMWLLEVGRFEHDVCVRLGLHISLELEGMPIHRGNVTIGQVRSLLFALRGK